jgi:prolipoprotein diacylglyceryltransferase
VISSIRLDFDPAVVILGMPVRLETLAIACAVFLVIVLTAIGAGRAGGLADDAATALPRLRRDDLILVAFGAVPGAVVGGRIGYGLIHLDYYRTAPAALFDPSQGGLTLSLAVVVGALTAMAVARLLSAPIRRWLAVVALPLLVGLGLGKLAMVLGGAGQGSYSDASYATSYAQAGPWESANASYPAIPSQAIEGLAVLALAAVVFVLPSLLRLRLRRWRLIVRPGLAAKRDWSLLTGGRRFLTLLGLWAFTRFAVAFSWRDASVWGSLRAEQLVLIPIIVIALLGPGFVSVVRWSRAGIKAWRAARKERLAAEAAEAEVARIAAQAAAEAAAVAAAEAAEAARIAAETVAATERETAEKAVAEAQAAAEKEAADKAATEGGAAAGSQAREADDDVAAPAEPEPDSVPDDGLTFDHKTEQSARAVLSGDGVDPNS